MVRNLEAISLARSRASRLVHLAAALTIAVFLGLVARFWHPVYGLTALFQLDASNDNLKVTAFRELPVYVYRDTGGYDGLYYAQIALDPSLRDPELRRATDNLSYRAHRIFPPVIAWVMGLGRPAAVIAAYSIINVLAWLALAVLLWRILRVNDMRGWLAWAGTLFSAGALCSVRLALTDLTAATLVAAAMLAAECVRPRTAVACIAIGTLSRETAVLGIVGLVKPPWFSFKNAARVVLAVLPLLAWLAYLRWRVGAADQGASNLSWPLVAFFEKWRDAIRGLVEINDPLLGIATLLATIALTAQLAFVILHPEPMNRWWRMAAAYAGLMIMLGTPVWEGNPGAATRVLIPLTLAFNVLAHRSRTTMAWLVLGNLGVFAGLHAMRDVPADASEIATVRHGTTACIAHIGTGWYDRERTSHHAWTWTRHDGSIQLEAWPRHLATIRLEFGLRSLAPRTVVLRQDGREIWRGDVGTKLVSHAIDIEIASGTTTLAFSTNEPPVAENGSPAGRALAFALYDVRVAVPNR